MSKDIHSFCVVTGCETVRKRQNYGFSYHYFPDPLIDPGRYQVWMHALKRKDFIRHRRSFVCSRHFEDSDYSTEPYTSYFMDGRVCPKNKTVLKPSAVPHLHMGAGSKKSSRSVPKCTGLKVPKTTQVLDVNPFETTDTSETMEKGPKTNVKSESPDALDMAELFGIDEHSDWESNPTETKEFLPVKVEGSEITVNSLSSHEKDNQSHLESPTLENEETPAITEKETENTGKITSSLLLDLPIVYADNDDRIHWGKQPVKTKRTTDIMEIGTKITLKTESTDNLDRVLLLADNDDQSLELPPVEVEEASVLNNTVKIESSDTFERLIQFTDSAGQSIIESKSERIEENSIIPDNEADFLLKIPTSDALDQPIHCVDNDAQSIRESQPIKTEETPAIQENVEGYDLETSSSEIFDQTILIAENQHHPQPIETRNFPLIMKIGKWAAQSTIEHPFSEHISKVSSTSHSMNEENDPDIGVKRPRKLSEEVVHVSEISLKRKVRSNSPDENSLLRRYRPGEGEEPISNVYDKNLSALHEPHDINSAPRPPSVMIEQNAPKNHEHGEMKMNQFPPKTLSHLRSNPVEPVHSTTPQVGVAEGLPKLDIRQFQSDLFSENKFFSRQTESVQCEMGLETLRSSTALLDAANKPHRDNLVMTYRVGDSLEEKIQCEMGVESLRTAMVLSDYLHDLGCEK